jgi:hypothetical protein
LKKNQKRVTSQKWAFLTGVHMIMKKKKKTEEFKKKGSVTSQKWAFLTGVHMIRKKRRKQKNEQN